MAFELIFHRSKGKLMGFLKKSLPADEDEESVMQDIYLKLWVGRKTIHSDKDFETYLYSIARNQVIDVLRKRLNKLKYLEELHDQMNQVNVNMDPFSSVEYTELETMIHNLIDQLPDQRREIFKLSRLGGLTYKKIAEKLNISENTVDTQIRNALSFLRKKMNHSNKHTV